MEQLQESIVYDDSVESILKEFANTLNCECFDNNRFYCKYTNVASQNLEIFWGNIPIALLCTVEGGKSFPVTFYHNLGIEETDPGDGLKIESPQHLKDTLITMLSRVQVKGWFLVWREWND